MIDREKIIRYLHQPFSVIVYDCTDSTNDRARDYLSEHDLKQAVFVANEQTAGRGRMGRRFYSPPDTGIYMTYVFHTNLPCPDTLGVTAAAALAVLNALHCGAKIKWVNDLYLNGRKICGILTEALSAGAHGQYLLVGIGINLNTVDFPEELRETAGSIHGDLEREQTIAAICNELVQAMEDVHSRKYLADYRRHLLGVGHPICYTENGYTHEAVMDGVDDFGRLIVTENGKRRTLCTGEITMHQSMRNREDVWT